MLGGFFSCFIALPNFFFKSSAVVVSSVDIKRILASPTHYSKVDRLKETRVMIDFLSLSLRFSFGEVLNRCLSRCFEEKAEEKKRGKGGGVRRKVELLGE